MYGKTVLPEHLGLAADKRLNVFKTSVGNVITSLVDELTGHGSDEVCNRVKLCLLTVAGVGLQGFWTIQKNTLHYVNQAQNAWRSRLPENVNFLLVYFTKKLEKAWRSRKS